MDTLLITGGGGFIGSNLARRALATTDARVVVLDHFGYAGHRATLADLAGEVIVAGCVFRSCDSLSHPAVGLCAGHDLWPVRAGGRTHD